MCPLVNELKRRFDKFDTNVVVTGQHREMLDQVLRVFNVKPDYDLAIMRPGQTLFDVTSDVLLRLKAILENENLMSCLFTEILLLVLLPRLLVSTCRFLSDM